MSTSTNNSTSSTSSGSLPATPRHTKRFLIVQDRNNNIAKTSIDHEVTFEDLMNDLNKLHEELEDVVTISNKIKIDCCSFLSCFSKNKTKASVKADNNKVSIV